MTSVACPPGCSVRLDFAGVNEKLDAARPNVAVTLSLKFIVMVHVLVPAQRLHPAKLDPLRGVAVKVTAVPSWYVAEQVVPQLMPPGLLVTVPLPRPVRVTESPNSQAPQHLVHASGRVPILLASGEFRITAGLLGLEFEFKTG
jgi:hypothetical protein